MDLIKVWTYSAGIFHHYTRRSSIKYFLLEMDPSRRLSSTSRKFSLTLQFGDCGEVLSSFEQLNITT